MGGDVAVGSEPGNGSVFTVTLRLRAAPPDDAGAALFAAAVPARRHAAGGRVLVATTIR